MDLNISSVAIDVQRTIDGESYPHVYRCESNGATIADTCG